MRRLVVFSGRVEFSHICCLFLSRLHWDWPYVYMLKCQMSAKTFCPFSDTRCDRVLNKNMKLVALNPLKILRRYLPVFMCIQSQQNGGSMASLPMPFSNYRAETSFWTQTSGFFKRLRSLGSPTKIYIKVLRPPSFWLWRRGRCPSMRELRTQFFKNHLAGCSPCFLVSAMFKPFVLLGGGLCRFQSSPLQ